jgi:hypothetical protein
MKESVAALGFLVAYAATKGIAYRMLAFDAAPEWLPALSDPTPTQGRNGPKNSL